MNKWQPSNNTSIKIPLMGRQGMVQQPKEPKVFEATMIDGEPYALDQDYDDYTEMNFIPDYEWQKLAYGILNHMWYDDEAGIFGSPLTIDDFASEEAFDEYLKHIRKPMDF
jgi:hypothetical protein